MSKVTRLTLDQDGVLERRRLHLREISDEADMPLETVGQDLRAARQRKGEDLATVSKALKIRKDHLDAIEESRLDELPGRAYAIGFLRTYAEYLGLDQAQCVERFKAEIAGRENASDDPVAALRIEEERRLPQGWLVFAVFLVLAVIYGAYYLSRSADRILAQAVTPVPTQITEQAALAAPRPAPEVITDATPVEPAPVPAEAPAGDAGTQLAAIPPQAAAPAAPEPVPETLPQGQVYGERNTDSRVVLRAHAPVRILVQDTDNKVFINRVLRAGDSYRAPNLVGLKVSIPDAGAVEIILDGASMGYVGKSGAIAEALSIDPQSIVDRYAQGHPG